MISHADKMIANAAMDAITKGFDVHDNARTLLSICADAPRFWWSISGTYRPDTGSDIRGSSPGHGEITIRDETPSEKTMTIGGEPDRIGQYRVRRSGNEVQFWHYWASTMETDGDEFGSSPDVYVIGHNSRNVLRYVGVFREADPRVIRVLPRVRLVISKRKVTPILGKPTPRAITEVSFLFGGP
jgi:hypothetical protein